MKASRLTRVALWSSFFRALAALRMFLLTQSHIVVLLLGWQPFLQWHGCVILEEPNYLYMLNGLQLLYQY